jgi:hypothetical protein
MSFFDFITIAIILTTFSFVFYLLYSKNIQDERDIRNIVTDYTDTVNKISLSFMEEIGKVERNHFEQVEKQSTKQLQILEKQTKDFIGVMEKFIENNQPKQLVPDHQFLDKILERENTISKQEVEEKNLDEIDRIPIVNGMNVQFEGEEEIMPINIS